MTRVLLVEDHLSFREAMALACERESDMSIVGQIGSVAEACAFMEPVDVAVVDLTLVDGRGVDAIRELRRARPHVRTLVLTAGAPKKELASAVEAGAGALLFKTAPLAEIIQGIRRVATGESLIAPRDVVEMLREAALEHERDDEAERLLESLTRRERAVLQALADGLHDREIAERLQVSHDTARNHVARVLSKLGVESRLQAVVLAARYGAVEIR